MDDPYSKKINHSGTNERHHVIVVLLDGITDDDLKQAVTAKDFIGKAICGMPVF